MSYVVGWLRLGLCVRQLLPATVTAEARHVTTPPLLRAWSPGSPCNPTTQCTLFCASSPPHIIATAAAAAVLGPAGRPRPLQSQLPAAQVGSPSPPLAPSALRWCGTRSKLP